MDCHLDIFFLEAVINGLLLGGILALLALGLNLIFGVIDVVWICYAEMIMIGMYGSTTRTRPARPSSSPPSRHRPGRGGRRVLHQLVIRPVLDGADQPAPRHRRRALPPAGGGDAGLRHRVPEHRHPPRLGERVDMSFASSRLVAFVVALAGMLAL